MTEEAKVLQALVKPVDTLINRISDAVGIVYEPTQIRRKAMAEADAKAIVTQGDIDATDLQRRAFNRLAGEEAKKQENIESVLGQAIPQIKEDAKPEDLDDDWLSNYFDKLKTVSDVDAQRHWAELLAEEVNQPGRFSKRAINALHALDRKDAKSFENLARFLWGMGELVPLIFDLNDEIYKRNDITFVTLQHLQSIDLIHYNSVGGYVKTGLKGKSIVYYCDKPLELHFGDGVNAQLRTGSVMLTQIGRELASLTNVDGIDGFYDYVAEKWSEWTQR